MAKYKKIPVVVEVYFWDGNPEGDFPSWLRKAINDKKAKVCVDFNNIISIQIETLGGSLRVLPGNYIILGVMGEIYPCKSDIFEMTYELVSE